MSATVGTETAGAVEMPCSATPDSDMHTLNAAVFEASSFGR
jgi:hypothetical protein